MSLMNPKGEKMDVRVYTNKASYSCKRVTKRMPIHAVLALFLKSNNIQGKIRKIDINLL